MSKERGILILGITAGFLIGLSIASWPSHAIRADEPAAAPGDEPAPPTTFVRRMALQKAEGDVRDAERALQIAEIAIKEYLEGRYPLQEQKLEGRLKLAEFDFTRAQKNLELADEKEPPSRDDAQRALMKAQFDLQVAKTQLDVLRRYTKEKRHKELQAAVGRARGDLEMKVALLKLETLKSEK